MAGLWHETGRLACSARWTSDLQRVDVSLPDGIVSGDYVIAVDEKTTYPSA